MIPMKRNGKDQTSMRSRRARIDAGVCRAAPSGARVKRAASCPRVCGALLMAGAFPSPESTTRIRGRRGRFANLCSQRARAHPGSGPTIRPSLCSPRVRRPGPDRPRAGGRRPAARRAARPPGRGSFERYVEVVETGDPWVDEVSLDTTFGEGYVRGTFLRRTAKIGDGLIVLLTDVTEQRRMEAELRGFADMVAHDLREPVTGIAHLVTLLERRAEQPPDPAVLDLLRASTERARELIDGVLAYARAGELQLAPVDLGTLVAEVEADLRPRLDEAGATLEAGPMPEVRGDARQLRRLLQNLVSNAVKFRGAEPPRIAVSAESAA